MLEIYTQEPIMVYFHFINHFNLHLVILGEIIHHIRVSVLYDLATPKQLSIHGGHSNPRVRLVWIFIFPFAALILIMKYANYDYVDQ